MLASQESSQLNICSLIPIDVSPASLQHLRGETADAHGLDSELGENVGSRGRPQPGGSNPIVLNRETNDRSRDDFRASWTERPRVCACHDDED